MRNITVGFVLGLLFAGLLGSFNPHTSTFLQSRLATVFAQTKPQLRPLPPDFKPNQWVPAVPIPPRTIRSGNINELQIVEVDGTNSEDDVFRNTTFVYGGGAYRLANASVQGAYQLVLLGAAANTAQFLTQFGLVGCPVSVPHAPPHVDMDKPIIKTADLKAPIKGDLLSPYGQR